MNRRRLYVDNRYVGDHGIARYAREVISRLTLPWEPAGGTYRPGSPLDAISRGRARLPKGSLLYNPGYTAGVTRATQLVTVHDLTQLRVDGPRRAVFQHYFDRIIRPAIQRTGHVLTVSETSAREVASWVGAGVTVHNAGNGCSQAFRIDGPAADLGRPYFLYVGNLKSHKNPAPVFRAMRAFPGHDLVVVSGDTESIARLSAEAGVARRPRQYAGIDDARLAELYRGAEALLFPSVWEGFGLPVLEAIRSGTKVVYATAAESVAEICGVSQFPVEQADDSDEFVAMMHAALDATFEAPAHLAEYDWDAVSRRVLSTIDVVWEGR